MIGLSLSAIKHDADSAQAHALAAQGHAHKERYDLALQMVDFADLLNQGEPGVYYHCADACFHAGRYERAIDLLN
jgi:hypothetical protein